MCGFFVSSFFEYFMTLVTLQGGRGEGGLVFAAFWQLSIGIWRGSYDIDKKSKKHQLCVWKKLLKPRKSSFNAPFSFILKVEFVQIFLASHSILMQTNSSLLSCGKCNFTLG